MARVTPLYETINRLVDEIQPKKILNVAKVSCQEWLSIKAIPYLKENRKDLHIDYFLIREPAIGDEEEKKYRRTHFSFPTRWVTFEEFVQTPLQDSYDLIILDTVHYREYADWMFTNLPQKCRGAIVIHDTLPPTEGTLLTCAMRTEVSHDWAGQTYLSYHNFHQANSECAVNVDDRFVGYGIIDLRNNPVIVTDYDCTATSDLATIKATAISHEDYLKNSNSSALLRDPEPINV
jgi:hypothetical protein